MPNKSNKKEYSGAAARLSKVYNKSGSKAIGHRSKYDCPCYDKPTKWCTKLMKACVGYSSELCPRNLKPVKGKAVRQTAPVPEVGSRVVHMQNGLGTVVEKKQSEQGTQYVVEFIKSGTRAKYSLQETQKMLRPEIKKRNKD